MSAATAIGPRRSSRTEFEHRRGFDLARRASGAQRVRTLDDLICGAWEGLAAGVAVACPVCGGALEVGRGAEAGTRGAGCRRCGSRLT